MRPIDISFENANGLWERLYGEFVRIKPKKKPKYSVGDKVRISLKKPVFSKGYYPTFTDEIFEIENVVPQKPTDLYFLKDNEGEKVAGRFYSPELNKIRQDSETSYRIEKIVATKNGPDGKTFKVKFIGYPKLYWIPEKDIVI